MRFQTLAIFLFLSSTAPAVEPKPASLSREEFAAGWVSLFDGETTFGWISEGSVTVKDGFLSLGKERYTVAIHDADFGDDWEMEFQLVGGNLLIGMREYKIDSKTLNGKQWGVVTFKRVNGEIQKPICKDIKLEDAEKTIINRNPIQLHADKDHPMSIRSINIRPTKTTDLFNGKDLTGWKRFTGNPKQELSKFEVTKDGELHLTNGPGDLQTEKSFRDFCLQLECKTNGDKLNSGIFFRCLPGQYQQGYEAQIHNGFKDNDRTKPTDFGTGAIYRRTPARKVVPDDNEWFTMTVLAVGPRLRTWVNGYPAVDWVDERPANANARSGRKLDAGPISIQGHDPTTELLFRNIRIAEIATGPKK